jgi:hypothetical protein
MDPLEDGTPDYTAEDAVAEYAEDRQQWAWQPIPGTFTRPSEAPAIPENVNLGGGATT